MRNVHTSHKDIRAALLVRLNPADTIEELGTGHCRVDVATVGKRFVGYEIKSDGDTLKRLPEQASEYAKVFDRCVAVVTRRHLDGVTAMLPKWWGIMLAEEYTGGVDVRWKRRPRVNHDCLNKGEIVRMMWTDEIRAMLRAHGLNKGHSRSPCYVLWQVAEAIQLDEVRKAMRQALKSRFGFIFATRKQQREIRQRIVQHKSLYSGSMAWASSLAPEV